MLDTAAAATFGLISRLRGARSLHPRGEGRHATLRITTGAPDLADVPLLARPGEHPAVIRLSRGAGLPAPLPDVLGLAVRLLDVHGDGRHQDFLLASSIDAPLLHHLLVPAPGAYGSRTYSSVLPYRIGGALRLVGACPAPVEGGAPRFRLAVAPLMGRWRPVGDLTAGAPLAADVTEQLAFTPWNTGGGIEPAGPFNPVRRAAYRGSQAGRGLPARQIP